MNTQPEALRLADALEQATYLLSVERENTAAELRRLYEANQVMLEALNALVAAHGSILDLRESDELKLARAAITKGEQQ
jgi:hypothetical protein